MKFLEVATTRNTNYLYEGLNLTEARSMKLWESAGHAISEAELTPQQIEQLFKDLQAGAVAGGGNRTALGKGKDVASAVNAAYGDLKTKIANSGPIKNIDAQYDQAAEKLKQATGGDQGVMQYVQKYRDLAKKYPKTQSGIYALLIAAAGISGVGLGGAAALGLLKMSDKLLQGEKLSSAAYQGGKTAAISHVAGQVGQHIRGDHAVPDGPKVRTGATSSTADLGDQPTARTSKLVNRPGDFSDQPVNRGLTTNPKQIGGMRTGGGYDFDNETPTKAPAPAAAPAAGPTVKNPQFDPMGNYTGVDNEVPAAPKAAAPQAKSPEMDKAVARATDASGPVTPKAGSGDVTKGFSNDVDKAIADKNSRYSVFKKPTGQVSGTGIAPNDPHGLGTKPTAFGQPTGDEYPGAKPAAGVAKGPTADTMADNNLASIKNNRDVMNDFAKKMGLTGDNHKASFSGGVPTEIDGKPVPDNLYTSDQRANIKAAKQMAAQMQGDYKDVMGHQAKIKADYDAQMQAVNQARRNAGEKFESFNRKKLDRSTIAKLFDSICMRNNQMIASGILVEAPVNAQFGQEMKPTSVKMNKPRMSVRAATNAPAQPTSTSGTATANFGQQYVPPTNQPAAEPTAAPAAKPGFFGKAASAIGAAGQKIAGSAAGQAVAKGASAAGQKIAQTGQNLTNKVTTDKLNKAWRAANSPTDSDQIADIVRKAGVSDDVLSTTYKNMKLPAPKAAAPQPTTADKVQQGAQAVGKAAGAAVTGAQKFGKLAGTAIQGAKAGYQQATAGNKATTSVAAQASKGTPVALAKGKAAPVKGKAGTPAPAAPVAPVDKVQQGAQTVGKVAAAAVTGAKKLGKLAGNAIQGAKAGYQQGNTTNPAQGGAQQQTAPAQQGNAPAQQGNAPAQDGAAQQAAGPTTKYSKSQLNDIFMKVAGDLARGN